MKIQSIIIALLLCLFISMNYAIEINCTTAVAAALAGVQANCTAEITAMGTAYAVAGDRVTDSFFDVSCSVSCQIAFEGYLSVSVCENAKNPAGLGLLGINAETFWRFLGGLRATCRISSPDPTPGRTRCGAAQIAAIVNARTNIERDCGNIDNTTAATVCVGACKQTREQIEAALVRCRHREGIMDKVSGPVTRLRMRAVDRACDLAERARDTIQECRKINFTELYADIRAECGNPGENDTVSLRCRVAVRASLKLFHRCVHLFREASEEGIFTEQVRNVLRRWRRAAGVRATRIEARVDALGDIVYSSTDDLRPDIPTTENWVGIDAHNRLAFRTMRREQHDGPVVERMSISLEQICEVRLNVSTLAGSGGSGMGTGGMRAFDVEADASLIVRCHNLEFNRTRRDCVNIDIGTSYTGVDRSSVDIPSIRNYTTANPTRLFRTACNYGPAGLSRVIINHAIVSEESESFGLRARAGGNTAPWVFSDLPRLERDQDHAFAVCVLIDTEDTVSLGDIEPVEVTDDVELEAELSESVVPVQERTSAEVRIQNRRFRFRKWAYCNADVKLRVRSRCTLVDAPDGIDAETPRRHRCCFTFVRTGSEICDRIYFDPSVSSEDEDDDIPAPVDSTTETTGTETSNTGTGTGTDVSTSDATTGTEESTTSENASGALMVPVFIAGAIMMFA